MALLNTEAAFIALVETFRNEALVCEVLTELGKKYRLPRQPLYHLPDREGSKPDEQNVQWHQLLRELSVYNSVKDI